MAPEGGSPDEEVSPSSRAALAASSALGWESKASEDARARRAGPPRTPPLLQAAAPSDDATCGTMAAALEGSATLREPRPRALGGTMATESAPSEAWARSSEASPWCGLGPSPQGEADRLRPSGRRSRRRTQLYAAHLCLPHLSSRTQSPPGRSARCRNSAPHLGRAWRPRALHRRRGRGVAPASLITALN